MPFIQRLVLVIGLLGFASFNACAQEDEEYYDPWQGFNRVMYSFNSTLDKAIYRPITVGYKAVTPDFVERSVSNVFSNLWDVRNLFNSLLQAKAEKSLNYLGRFLFNSTLGLFGVIDIASGLGLPKDGGEDFGQTLATWGVGSGPYLVLPLFGPSTLRDTGGSFFVDGALDPVPYVDHVPTRNTLTGVRLLDVRASLLEAEKLISGDEYIFVRNVYLQRREYLINDGEVEDDFGDDFEEDETF